MSNPTTVSDELTRRIAAQSPCVVMLVGAPGSGKSTFAATLARQLGGGAAVLSYEAHRAEVTGDPADPAGDPKAGQLLRERLTQRCAAAMSTIVDGTHHLARSRARLAAVASDAGIPAVAIVLTTSLAVCLARQQTRSFPAPGKQHSLRVPEHHVRNLHLAIQQAHTSLAGEGFTAYMLGPGDTAPGNRTADAGTQEVH